MKRRGFLQSIFFGTSLASVFSSVVPRFAKAASNASITKEIELLLRQTEEIWDSQETGRLRELWDTDDAEPYYLAGEQDNWFIGWDAINRYLAPPPGAPKITEAIRVRFYDIHARLLSPDLAFAAYWMRTDMKLVFSPKPFASDNRVAAIFRRKPEGWRYVTYTEAFQAPTIYMQKLSEKDVSPDYQEFYDQVMKK